MRVDGAGNLTEVMVRIVDSLIEVSTSRCPIEIFFAMKETEIGLHVNGVSGPPPQNELYPRWRIAGTARGTFLAGSDDLPDEGL
jgi:hypothetical protein